MSYRSSSRCDQKELAKRYGTCSPNPAGRPRGPNLYDSVIDVGNGLRLELAGGPLVGPTPGEGVINLLCGCLRDVLLHKELLIPSMFRFSADIGHAGFLVFKDVEDFALHCAPLDFIAWKRGVELLLLCGLWSAHPEPGCGEQRFGLVCLACFHAGAAGKENDAAGGQDENQV